jgi:hypothetical protein
MLFVAEGPNRAARIARGLCERRNRASGAHPYYPFDAVSIGVVSSEMPGPMLELK